MKLKIKVERVEFDMEQCSLRLNGKNVEENEFVKLGQYHTLDIVIGRPIAIEKECWDFIFMGILNDACDPGKKADVAVVGTYVRTCVWITFFLHFYSYFFSVLKILVDLISILFYSDYLFIHFFIHS